MKTSAVKYNTEVLKIEGKIIFKGKNKAFFNLLKDKIKTIFPIQIEGMKNNKNGVNLPNNMPLETAPKEGSKAIK